MLFLADAQRKRSPMDIRRTPKSKKPQAALLGLAFDAADGHKRITRGRNFVLAGGSQETHGMMQETAIKINERLDKAGKQLSDVSINELRDIVADIRK
jgi:hypothetical protein